jgi:hypothetical protein
MKNVLWVLDQGTWPPLSQNQRGYCCHFTGVWVLWVAEAVVAGLVRDCSDVGRVHGGIPHQFSLCLNGEHSHGKGQSH